MKRIRVSYFALLREQRGLADEELDTGAATARALYEELRSRHGFTLPPDHVRAAVNDSFVAPEAALQAGDRVVFIPPVAGG